MRCPMQILVIVVIVFFKRLFSMGQEESVMNRETTSSDQPNTTSTGSTDEQQKPKSTAVSSNQTNKENESTKEISGESCKSIQEETIRPSSEGAITTSEVMLKAKPQERPPAVTQPRFTQSMYEPSIAFKGMFNAITEYFLFGRAESPAAVQEVDLAALQAESPNDQLATATKETQLKQETDKSPDVKEAKTQRDRAVKFAEVTTHKFTPVSPLPDLSKTPTTDLPLILPESPEPSLKSNESDDKRLEIVREAPPEAKKESPKAVPDEKPKPKAKSAPTRARPQGIKQFTVPRKSTSLYEMTPVTPTTKKSEETPVIRIQPTKKSKDVKKKMKRLFRISADFDPAKVMAQFQNKELNGIEHITRIKSEMSRNLKDQPYFHGLMPRDQVEQLLAKSGEFLVRETEETKTKKITPTISVKWKKQMKHILVPSTRGKINLDKYRFNTIPDLIDFMRASQTPLGETGVLLQMPVYRRTWQFNHDQIKLLSKLGEGAFGEVHRGILTDQDRTFEVAVKIQGQGRATRQERLDFMAEFNVMRKFRHPNVVFVYGVAVLEDPIMIVMEFLSGGSLLGYLRSQNIRIQPLERVRFCCEASAGMRYLEKQKCLHRDVATRNCLLSAKQEIKIADFGLSRFDAMFREQKGKKVPIRWLAPETLSKGIYSPETDVWSFGVLMWEVFADGKDPYPGLTNTQVRQKITHIEPLYRMSMPLGTPQSVVDLSQRCWHPHPDKRPKFDAIFKKLSALYKAMKKP